MAVGSSTEIGIRVFLDDAASGGLGAINRQFGLMGGIMDTLTMKMSQVRGEMIGLSVLGGAVASFILFGAAIKTAVEDASQFQQSMFAVAVATHVPMTAAMQYTNQLMNLAAGSTYTSAQIADGIVQLGRAGYSLKDIMGVTADGMHGMAAAGIALGIATRTTAVQGFQMLSQAMSAYHLPASQALRVADLLQFAFEHQRGSVAELTGALSQVTPQAAQFHVGLRDVVAALDVVGPAMKNTSVAGTALRYMLAGLYSPTAAGEKEMIALGLASVDAHGKFHSAFYDSKGNAVDFTSALKTLNDHLKGLNQEARNQALHNLFSVRGGQGAAVLLDNIQKYLGYLKQLQTTQDNAGGAMRRWQEVMHTFGGAMAGLKSSFTDLGIAIGLTLLPVLTNFANFANGVISAVRQWAVANPQAAHTFLLVGAALSAVVVVGFIVLAIVTGIGSGFLLLVGIVAGTIAAIIGLSFAITALIGWLRQPPAIVRSIFSAFQAFGAFIGGVFVQVWHNLKNAFSTVMPALHELGAAMAPVVPILKQMGLVVAAVGALLVGVFIGALHGVIAAIGAVITGLGHVIAGIVGIFSGVIQIVTGILRILVGIFTLNGNLIARGWQMLWNGIQRTVAGIGQAILGVIIAVFGGIIAFIGGFVHGIVGFFHWLASVLVGHSIIPDMMNAIRNVIMSVLSAIAGFIGSILSHIAGLFMAGVNVIRNVWNAGWNFVRFIVQGAWNAISGAVSGGVSHIIGLIAGAASNVIGKAHQMWDGFTSAVRNGVSTAVSTIAGLPGKIGGILSGLIGQMANWGSHMMSALADGIKGAWGAVTGAVSGVIGWVSSHLHFSKPDAGPLADIDTWMPDMMKLLASGIESHTPLVGNAAARAAGAISGNIAGVPSVVRAAAPTLNAGVGVGGTTTVNLVLDGNIIGQAVLNRITGQMQMNGFSRAFR